MNPRYRNQGTLYRDATAILGQIQASDRSLEAHKTVDAGHDRVEIRRCWAVDVEEKGLVDTERWTHLRTLCKGEAQRHHPGGSVESEERLFISSLEADPKRLLRAVRAHWHIENKLHWTLDVAFEEDKSRVRPGEAAQNLAVVRRLALSLLKQETSRSEGIQTKRMEAAWNPDYLLKVLNAGN